MYRKYTYDQIRNAVSSANTLKSALHNLGLSDKGSNRKTIKRYISEYALDCSHFDAETERLKGIQAHSTRVKIPLSHILVENSSYNRTQLKERLYSEGIKERKCELCGQTEMWFGKRMSLIIDHINGVHNDNRLNNLRIVCPNCNATLDTHCGKNLNRRTINAC